MNRPTMQAIQDRLYVLCFDDYSAETFTSGLVLGSDTSVRWQAAVDTLYRLAVCELIWSPSLPDGQGEGEGLIASIDELSRVDPFPPGNLADAWLGLDVLATKLSTDLMSEYGVMESKGAPNEAFSDALRSIFSDCGVSYEIYPVRGIALAAGLRIE